jgi:putative tricarboxylic transport membrane protein
LSKSANIVNRSRVADLVILLVLSGLVILYGLDAYSASSHILNLILVLPVIVIVLVLCLIQFIIEIRDAKAEAPARESAADVAPVIGLFAAYVLTLQWIGFDIGTMLFVAAFLWLQGERRWHWLIGYSISLSFGLSIFFSAMLPYPMPMLILQSAY